MRKILIAICAVLGLAALTPAPEASAAPVSGAAAIVDSLNAGSMIQEARVYCYNRYTGRFLHWGSCWRPRHYYYYRPYHRHHFRRHYHYRVYCYSRRTGRFLHWGHC